MQIDPQKPLGDFSNAPPQTTKSKFSGRGPQESALLKNFPNDLHSQSVGGNFKTFTPSFESSLLDLPVFQIMHFNINRIELCNLNF